VQSCTSKRPSQRSRSFEDLQMRGQWSLTCVALHGFCVPGGGSGPLPPQGYALMHMTRGQSEGLTEPFQSVVATRSG
jgi:hypothetical protein